MAATNNEKKRARRRPGPRLRVTRRPLAGARTAARLVPVACICLAAVLTSGFACVLRAGAAERLGSENAPGDSGPGSGRIAVGFVTGHGEPSPDGQLTRVAEALRATATVTEVHLSDGATAVNGVDVVVVAGAPDVPDAELYVLDQFLMRGGRAAFLLDAAVLPATGTQANLSGSNIFGFLSAYGITVNPDLVLDSACADGATWGGITTSSAYPYWPVVSGTGISADHPALSGVTCVPMAWTSSVTARLPEQSDARISVLLRSSVDSRTVSAFVDVDPGPGFEPPSGSDDVNRVAGAEGFPLAIAVEGRLRSAFAGQKVIVQRGRKVEFTEPAEMVETSAQTKMVVFGSSMMFRDDLAAQLPGNAELLAGVVNWLASAEDEPAGSVDAAAGREWTPRRLAFVVLALAVLVAAAATAAGARRKRSSRT